MATNPYNQPNAVSTAGSQTYSKSAVKAGRVNPYDSYGAANSAAALADQKSRQTLENATAEKVVQAQKMPAVDNTKLTPDVKTNLANLKTLTNPDDQVKTLQQGAKAGLVDKSQAADLIGKIYAAQPKPQPKLSNMEKAGQASAGILKGGANLVGGIVGGAAEAINKGIVKPFLSSPSGALGGALADVTSGKGFDFRKQYQLMQKEASPLAQGAAALDKKTGTNISSGINYADKHTGEILAGTGAIIADIGTGGLLTPVIAPAFTGYYGTKYVKNIPATIKDINNTPDISQKFAKITEFVGQAALLGKGAKDTVSGARNLPTTKEVNLGGTVPNAQAREFFNSPNPDITPETSALLSKALADNKAKFVQELKGGQGVSVQDIQTVPTVYGKLLNIINTKLGKGQSLTPAEESVVKTATDNPGQFVKTKTVQKYTPPEPATPAPAAGAIAPVEPAPPVVPPLTTTLPPLVKPTAPVEAPVPQPGALKPLGSQPSAPTVNAVVSPELVDAKFVKPEIAHVPATALKMGADTKGSSIDKGTVAKYLGDIRAGNPIDPIVISREKNGQILVQDGKHRLAAMKQAGVKDIPVVEKMPIAARAEPVGQPTVGQPAGGGATAVPASNLESNRMQPTAAAPPAPKADISITYPETKKLPGNLRPLVPQTYKPGKGGMVGSPKEKLTANEAEQVTQQSIGWDRSKLRELVKTVPGLKENPVLTAAYRAGIKDPQKQELYLTAKIGSHEFSIPASSLGLNEERLAKANIKEGQKVDIGDVLKPGTNRVPVINKGKTSFSSTSGSAPKKAAPAEPKAEPAPEPKPEPTPEKKISNPVKKFIDETNKNKAVAGKLDDQLHALGGQNIADNIALNNLFKAVKKSNSTAADWTAIYHYAEDRNAPITPEQKALFEATIKPLQDGINTMREDMGLKAFKNNEFIHRIAQGHGSSLERYLQGETEDIKPGNVLRRTSDSMQSRSWMKLVDDEGNSHIVRISTPKDKLGKALGERQVTAFDNGKPTPMGALKRKIPSPVHEFYDPAIMSQLESIAKGLGLEHTRTNMPLKRGDRAAGVSYGGTNVIKTKTASPMDALLHEIGHQVDDRYGLQEQFLGSIKSKSSPAAQDEQRTITQELRDLADKRVGQDANKSFGKYVRSGEEKMAVMFQAYLHAPEIFKAVAPVTYDKFDAFLKSHPETKPIANIEKSLELGSQTIGDVRHEGEFIDKTGKKWQITNATTKEIESNSTTRYFKQPMVTTAIDYMQTRQALRASQFLDTWKSDPGFLYNPDTGEGIAIKSDAKTIPSGWQTTGALQFRGYHFDPRTAEVLDDFAKIAQRGDPLGAFTGMNLFLRNTIFYNPLMHVPNIMWHAAMRRGISGFTNPVRIARGTTSSIQAINEVIHKGDLYQTLLREGAPLMSFDRQGLTKMIGKMMEDTIQDDKAVTTLAKLAGYANKVNFAKAWYRVSSGVTWSSHDFFMLQAMIEEMKRGLTPQEAIHEVTAHIPDYRLPTRFLGSRSLKTTLANHNVTMFMPYHYGIYKSYANVVREMAGKTPRGGKEETGWTGKAKTSARGVDKLLMAGVIMLLIYPELDRLARQITGNQNAISRRAGPFTFPYAIYQMLQGNRSVQQTAATVLPTPPGSKGLIQLIRNRDDLNRQIWNPGDIFSMPAQAAKDIGHFVLGTIAPAQKAQQATSGKLTLGQFGQGLIGIQTPDHLKSLVSKLYSQQLNLGVQSKAQQRINNQKNAARDQIAAGQGDQLAKDLVTNGILSQDKLKQFETTAKWTPMQRTFDSLNMTNKLQVLQKANPNDWPSLGDMNALKTAAGKTSRDNKASAANKVAAGTIVQVLNGDKTALSYTNGQTTTHESILQSIGAYASAFKTSPLTAFNRIFTGQRILRTNNGAIIVERMPQSTSSGIRTKLGASKSNQPMQLDHIIPLEIGGSNDMSNLQLIPKSEDQANNPIENYLGQQLRANKINAKQAKQLILDYKHGKITAADVYKH